MMFRPEDLARLKGRAEVFGPFDKTDLTGITVGMAEAQVIVTGWGSPKFDELLLRAAPKVGLIAHSAGSVKGVITDAVYDRAVKVTTAANENAIPVAQYTIAMIVSLLKQVPWLSDLHKAGDRDAVVRRLAHCRELMDTEVAIIGASRVGREVIKLLRDYPRVTIKLYDPYVSDAQAREMGCVKVGLDDACRCEVVSIHAPNIPETRHMFNARTLALLPDHAVLINTARGALVDEAALVAEVRKRPLYVCLDVTDPEPPAPDSPLRNEENIILTPHIAGALKQARREMGRLAIDEALRFLDGRPLEHEVTREMLATQA